MSLRRSPVAPFVLLVILPILDACHGREAERLSSKQRGESSVPEAILDVSVRALWAEPGGRALWLSSEDGLYRVETASLRTTAHLARNWNGFQGAHAFHATPGGPVWIGTVDGLVRFEPQTGSFSWQRDPEGRRLGNVTAILPEPGSDALWLADWSKETRGLIRFDVATGAMRRYTRQDGLLTDGILVLEWDRAGATVLAGGWRGVARYDRPSDRFEPYAPAREARGRNVRGMAASAGGDVLWILLDDGVVRADVARAVSQTYLPPRQDGPVFGWLHPQLPAGILWIETQEKTLVRFDVATGRFTDIPGTLGALHPEADGRGVWLDLGKGLVRHDLTTGTGRWFPIRSWGLYLEPRGPAWVGSLYGLYRLDPTKGKETPSRVLPRVSG